MIHPKEKIIPHIISIGLVIATLLGFPTVFAQEINVVFPVAELGNCTDKESCKAFCDRSENMTLCIDFARKNKLMDEAELSAAENILKNGGPGGCKNREECESYCENISNLDQCVSFAEKHNLMPAEELAEAQKIQSALKRGVKMPPCKNKKECESYCSTPENMEMCINFAVEAGFMPQGEIEEAQKMLQALKKGIKPPPCRGKAECEEFCSRDENLDQCISFAEAAGFMTAGEAARTRKTGGKGPGGCRGAECEKFCNDPKNQEICFQFSVDNDLLSDEDKKRMNEGNSKIHEVLNQAPPEVVSCIKSKIGEKNYENIQSGKMYRQQGDPFRECFDEYYTKNRGQEPQDGQNRGEHERPRGEFDSKPQEGFDQRMMERPREGDFKPPENMIPSQALPHPSNPGTFDSSGIEPPEFRPEKTPPPGEISVPVQETQVTPPTSMNFGPEALQAFVFNALKLFLGMGI